MPLTIAIAIAAVIFVIWARRQRMAGGPPRAAKPQCDWHRIDPESARTLQEYRCATCGETGFGRAERPPATCKRSLRSGG